MSKNPWRVLRYTQPHFAKHVGALNRHAEPPASRQAAVAEIIAAVRKDGDDALIRYAKKWDGVDLTRAGLTLPSRTPKPLPAVAEAIDYAIKNVKSFSKLRKPRNWSRCEPRRRDGRREIRSIGARGHLRARRHGAAGFHGRHDSATREGSGECERSS